MGTCADETKRVFAQKMKNQRPKEFDVGKKKT